MSKVYSKRGTRSHTERKLETELLKAIDKKLETDSNFTLEPAKDLKELQEYHNHYCAEDATIVSETKDSTSINKTFVNEEENNINNTETAEMETEETSNASDMAQDADIVEEKKTFIDPMLRSNPQIRDYVTEENTSSMPDSEQQEVLTNKSNGGSIAEPTSFKDAFGELDNNPKAASNSSAPKPQKPQPSPPFNPAFDEMNKSQKNKQTKRFAKSIVSVVCMLTERGFIWWTTKDINESKLAEYELSKDIDLSLLLSLEDGQQVTVKQFFQIQEQNAKLYGKITEEEQIELTDALYDFLLEKGIAPTPTQNLIMVGISVIGKRAIIALQMQAQTNSVLAQLKEMNKPEVVEVEHEEVVEKPKKSKKVKTKKATE